MDYSSVRVESAVGENEELGPLGLGDGSSQEERSPTSPTGPKTSFGHQFSLKPTPSYKRRGEKSADG